MCGIAGIFNYRRPDEPADRAVLERVTRALAHRGPDGEGLHLDGPLGLGKPMLLSKAAAKPGLYAQFYSSTEATKEIGYKPKRTFKQAVTDMLNYYITHNLLVPHGRWVDKR